MVASDSYKTIPAFRNAAFKKYPLAFLESPQEEGERLQKLKLEDPIALQDAVNTSQALVEAVKEHSIDDVRSVVENAVEGEFLQVFVLQAVVLALKAASLEMVKVLYEFGAPFIHEKLQEALHLVCEVTNRDNFSDAWRILQLLIDGDGEAKANINQPRSVDGWTPLCVACADACLPLAFKLLEMGADVNVITRNNDTPVSLAKHRRLDDNEEQKEARDIICNMLRHSGGQERWQDALSHSRKPDKSRTSDKAKQDLPPVKE
mmetsp:Transcript_26236/g.39893  ORF Transcript_26236/g.39893 Transcript_26236/m.39893 type:complete len:262 (-) Transcript_26236:161-946(-)